MNTMGGRGGKGGPGPNPKGRTQPGSTVPGSSPGKGGSPGGGGKGGSKPGNASPGGVQNPGGGGGKGGGGGSNLPPKPKTWPDNLLLKPDNRRDTDQRLADDIAAVNPRYFEAPRWQVNCTRCAAVVELRARGYDVTAEPFVKGKNKDNLLHDITNKWVDKDGRERDFTWHWGENAEMLDFFNQTALSWGEGARGFIRVGWKKGGGHIFNVEVRDGEVRYIDGQPNEFDKGVSWSDRVEPGSYNGIIRTDDLTPKQSLKDDGWIRDRTKDEVNAPLRRELTEELIRRGYNTGTPFRDAFVAAWDDIRSGRGPKSKYSSVVELQQIYEAGIAWARRPD
ncbi:VIP2-like toxin [Mycobacterium phage Updawg]|nr:VIP2-like toxin [Mycobacterium phage Updawg]